MFIGFDELAAAIDHVLGGGSVAQLVRPVLRQPRLDLVRRQARPGVDSQSSGGLVGTQGVPFGVAGDVRCRHRSPPEVASRRSARTQARPRSRMARQNGCMP